MKSYSDGEDGWTVSIWSLQSGLFLLLVFKFKFEKKKTILKGKRKRMYFLNYIKTDSFSEN